jgi:hypothetical protein
MLRNSVSSGPYTLEQVAHMINLGKLEAGLCSLDPGCAW